MKMDRSAFVTFNVKVEIEVTADDAAEAEVRAWAALETDTFEPNLEEAQLESIAWVDTGEVE